MTSVLKVALTVKVYMMNILQLYIIYGLGVSILYESSYFVQI